MNVHRLRLLEFFVSIVVCHAGHSQPSRNDSSLNGYALSTSQDISDPAASRGLADRIRISPACTVISNGSRRPTSASRRWSIQIPC